jgi:hypothetical protein
LPRPDLLLEVVGLLNSFIPPSLVTYAMRDLRLGKRKLEEPPPGLTGKRNLYRHAAAYIDIGGACSLFASFDAIVHRFLN